MATAIGWYGPLIDLCKASSYVGDYVQLVVFVHQFTPIQVFLCVFYCLIKSWSSSLFIRVDGFRECSIKLVEMEERWWGWTFWWGMKRGRISRWPFGRSIWGPKFQLGVFFCCEVMLLLLVMITSFLVHWFYCFLIVNLSWSLSKMGWLSHIISLCIVAVIQQLGKFVIKCFSSSF